MLKPNVSTHCLFFFVALPLYVSLSVSLSLSLSLSLVSLFGHARHFCFLVFCSHMLVALVNELERLQLDFAAYRKCVLLFLHLIAMSLPPVIYFCPLFFSLFVSPPPSLSLALSSLLSRCLSLSPWLRFSLSGIQPKRPKLKLPSPSWTIIGNLFVSI